LSGDGLSLFLTNHHLLQENNMKDLQKLCAAVTLIVVLSLSARAGEITTWGVTAPPPPASATATEPGHIGTDATNTGTESGIESEALVTQLTLSLLQLLSVF
jgi:hypothetical protein